MEVWSAWPCNFCRGTGVKAPKKVYDRWASILEQAILKVTEEEKPIVLLRLAKYKIIEEMAQYQDCSWCDGKQLLTKREPDEDV